jgi:hypothetical protein
LGDYVNYRSFLNANLPHPDASQATPGGTVVAEYEIPNANGPRPELFQSMNNLLPGEFAELNQIGKEKNGNLPFGPSMLFAKNGYFPLNNMHLRNVTLERCHVIYDGVSPVILENVYFVDCVFELVQADGSIKFGRALLTDAKVSLRLS